MFSLNRIEREDPYRTSNGEQGRRRGVVMSAVPGAALGLFVDFEGRGVGDGASAEC